MQNTTRKLMETDRGQESEVREEKCTSPKPRRIQSKKNTLQNAARFTYDVYEGFQRKEQTVAVAADLEDAYNRAQFKLLMELFAQYGISVTLTRWLAAALQERKVAMRRENWITTPEQLIIGLPQGSPCPQFLYNVPLQRDWRIWTTMV